MGTQSDQRARAFYEGLGWKPDGTRQTHPPTDLRYRLPIRSDLQLPPEALAVDVSATVRRGRP